MRSIVWLLETKKGATAPHNYHLASLRSEKVHRDDPQVKLDLTVVSFLLSPVCVDANQEAKPHPVL